VTGFLDTNILVHAFDGNSPFADVALGFIAPVNRIGVQSLNEFALVCRRKLTMDWADIHLASETVRGLSVEPAIALTLDIHLHGLQIAGRHRLHIYDSMLLAAALSADCTTFWSEDLHDGLVIDGRLTIRNPFA